MRTFETTHPWLAFRLRLDAGSVDLWLMLGEAASKVQHVADSLLKPAVEEELNTLYLAKGALATTAIEGNTLSEDEAIAAVEGRLHLPASQDYLRQEIQNVAAAYNAVVDELVRGDAQPFTGERIRDFNRQILADLPLGEDVVPGAYRTHSVVVGSYRAAPAKDCELLVDRLCAWLDGDDFVAPDPLRALPYAIVKAVVAHLYLAWIHPFGDGNGRIARMVEFEILLRAGVPVPAALLLSAHYNQTRAEYYRQLDQASRSGGDVLPFLHYAVRGFVDGLRSQLGVIWDQQFDARWEQYIYESFGAATSNAMQRRRLVVLDLSKRREPVRKAELRRLSPEAAEAYAGKTDKTLTRDVNALVEMGLIKRTVGGYEPNRDVIRAFLPVRTGGD
jgi:Fic family protein